MTNDSPRFEHDCDDCVFLGHHDGVSAGEAYRRDLYYCPPKTSLGPSLICRYGNAGHDYVSVLVRLASLGEDWKVRASILAQRKGLVRLAPVGDLEASNRSETATAHDLIDELLEAARGIREKLITWDAGEQLMSGEASGHASVVLGLSHQLQGNLELIRDIVTRAIAEHR